MERLPSRFIIVENIEPIDWNQHRQFHSLLRGPNRYFWTLGSLHVPGTANRIGASVQRFDNRVRVDGAYCPPPLLQPSTGILAVVAHHHGFLIFEYTILDVQCAIPFQIRWRTVPVIRRHPVTSGPETSRS